MSETQETTDLPPLDQWRMQRASLIAEVQVMLAGWQGGRSDDFLIRATSLVRTIERRLANG